jgi:hypothetical protein
MRRSKGYRPTSLWLCRRDLVDALNVTADALLLPSRHNQFIHAIHGVH